MYPRTLSSSLLDTPMLGLLLLLLLFFHTRRLGLTTDMVVVVVVVRAGMWDLRLHASHARNRCSLDNSLDRLDCLCPSCSPHTLPPFFHADTLPTTT